MLITQASESLVSDVFHMEYSVLPHHDDHFKSQRKSFTCIIYKCFLNGMLRTLVTLENPKIPFDTK